LGTGKPLEGNFAGLLVVNVIGMKPRNQFFLSIVFILFILGIALVTFFTRDQEPAQTFPATVTNDCAPWDGSAFTVAIKYDSLTEIYISIWKAPDIKLPSTVVLPDDEGQVGHAYILPELGPFVQLSGEVFLQSVSVDKPVEGRFRFKSERGELFEGKFKAEWGEEVIFCG
jgi:hypothetical protein